MIQLPSKVSMAASNSALFCSMFLYHSRQYDCEGVRCDCHMTSTCMSHDWHYERAVTRAHLAQEDPVNGIVNGWSSPSGSFQLLKKL